MSGMINFMMMGGGQSPIIESVYDENYINSIVYSNQTGYNIRNSASEWRFNYSGTYLGIKAKSTISAYPQFSKISILVNGALFQTVSITDESLHELSLPDGNKIVSIVDGALSKPSSIIGTFLTDVVVDSTKFSKINTENKSEKIVFIGDSITVGANSINPSTEGYALLFRMLGGKEVAILGYGYGAYKDFAETQEKINAVISQLTTLFSGVTTKKFVISLGTNDVGVYSLNGSTVKPWITSLVSQVKIAFPDIIITMISPIIRSDDNATFDGIRTAISEVATEQTVTHIYGKDILTLSDLDEGLHPTTAGMLKYYNAIKDVIS